MSQSFDLVREPWIPCLSRNGAPCELSLRETIVRAHDLREVAGESPLITGALYRLLLTILHRVYGPADESVWDGLWQRRRWDAAPLDAYLARWQGRFDLFDARHPFLQRSDARVKPRPVAILLPEVASGHNPTLFDHHLEQAGMSLTPAQAARALLGALAFGLAGLSGLPAKFTDAPCARGALFLAEGDNLFETLCLNLARYPREEERPDDRPAWEVTNPSLPARDRPLGRLDLFTWPNRNVLLLPERGPGGTVVRRVTMAPNLALHPDVLDPMKCYRIEPKRGHLVVRFTEERALWRDATLLLGSTQSSRPPLTVAWLRELVGWHYLPRERRLRFMALGMANDQARVDLVRAERLPLPLDYLADKGLVDAVEECLQLADQVSRQLWGATQTLARIVVSPQADLPGERQPARQDISGLTGQWAVERHYWSRLELPFRELLVGLPGDLTGGRLRWRETLRACAWEALEAVCRSLEQDMRRIKAVVRARDQLASSLGKVLRTVGG
ncbi:MAG: type I-E CRISPR-associated protein Cse1/CasA [Anaerolineae bacterium]|nr:type I-E CRISPR-associated protein Cse1/CasA [Anaerolineae bacterium]